MSVALNGSEARVSRCVPFTAVKCKRQREETSMKVASNNRTRTATKVATAQDTRLATAEPVPQEDNDVPLDQQEPLCVRDRKQTHQELFTMLVQSVVDRDAVREQQVTRGSLLWCRDIPSSVADKLSEMERGVRFEWLAAAHDHRVGTLVIYEVPTGPHDDISQVLRGLFAYQGPAIDNTTKWRGMADVFVGGNKFQPDESIRPRNRIATPGLTMVDGGPQPTIIIEVAHSESDSHVRNKALMWIDRNAGGGVVAPPRTTVQECWVLRTSNPRGWLAGRMWIERFERTAVANPTCHIEFGTAIGLVPSTPVALPRCVGAGTHTLVIPGAVIWNGVPGALPAANWTLDLFDVQQMML